MSSVGFTSNCRDIELDKLREAWKLLKDLLKNLANAEACLKNLDLKLTGDHIKVAKWNEESHRGRRSGKTATLKLLSFFPSRARLPRQSASVESDLELYRHAES